MNRYLTRLILLCCVIFQSSYLFAATYTKGDLAPRSASDGVLNVADILVLQRIINGKQVPTQAELKIADVAPFGAPDGQLNAADLVVLQRSIRDDIDLGSIIVYPEAPVLNSIPVSTSNNPQLVSGHAEPGMVIRVVVNGVTQEDLVAGSDGGFMFEAALYDGTNEIMAFSFDGEHLSQPSNVLHTTYTNNIDRAQTGPITTNTVWTPGLSSEPYILSGGDFIIEQGAVLTIQPGTIIKSDQQYITVNGQMIVNGTEFENVSFVPTEITTGTNDWRGIEVTSTGRLSMLHATVQHAYTGIYFNGGTGQLDQVSVNNSVIGIRIRGSSPLITASRITDNTSYGIQIQRDSSPVINNGNVITRNRAYGVVVEGEPGLPAESVPAPVINRNAIFNNTGLYYARDVIISDFDNARGAIINLRENWWGTTNLDTISNRIVGFDGNEIPVADYSYPLDAENGTPIDGNYLIGDLPDGTVLGSDTVFHVLQNLYVPSGSSVIMSQGVELRFGTNAKFVIEGNIDWQGVESNPSYFTRYEKDSLNNWAGIIFANNDSDISVNAIKVDNASHGLKFEDVALGGVSNSIFENNSTGILLDNSDVTISSNVIQYNSGSGIRIEYGSSPQVTDNVIIYNGEGGGAYAGVSISRKNPDTGKYPDPVITNNQIYGNRYYDIEARHYIPDGDVSIPIINARNNWWGINSAHEIEKQVLHVPDNNNNTIYNTAYIDYGGFYLDAEKTESDSRDLLFNFHTLETDQVIAANSRYIIIQDIVVSQGISLTIELGAELSFTDAAILDVYGGLQIQGTATSPVILTGAKTLHEFDIWSGIGEWSGVRINDTAGPVNIDYSIIEYATIGVDFINSGGMLSNSILKFNNTGVRIYGNSDPSINSNVIVENSYGIKIEGSDIDGQPLPSITNNDIYNNFRPGNPVNIETNIALRNIADPASIDLSSNWWNKPDIASIRASFYDYYSGDADLITINDADADPNRDNVFHTSLSVNESYISPLTSPGINDQLTIQSEMPQAVSWKIDIKNASRQVVKTFTGSGAIISQVWNGRNNTGEALPDGVYHFTMQINSGYPQTVANVVIDNTSPVSNIINPQLNQTLYVGDDNYPYIISGIANDTNFVKYDISIADSSMPIDGDYRFLSSNNTKSVYMSKLLVWPFADVNSSMFATSGPKTLRVTTYDKAGNSSSYNVQVNIVVPLDNVTHDVASIDPSKGEVATINFDLQEPATVKLRFYPEKSATTDDNIVAEVVGVYSESGNYSLQWDGREIDGNYLPDEAYRYAFLVVNNSGSFLHSSDEYIGGPGTGTRLGSDTRSNNFLNKFVKFTYELTEPARVTLGGFVSEPRDAGVHHFIWDQRDEDNKLYDVSVSLTASSVSHLRKNSIIVRGSMPEITGAEYDPADPAPIPRIEVQSTPYTVLHSFEQISEIVFRISQDSYVDVRLLKPCYVSNIDCTVDHDDPDGITLMERQLLEARDAADDFVNHAVEWRGYDFESTVIDANNIRVSEEGGYTFSIRAESAATGLASIYRGVINLHH